MATRYDTQLAAMWRRALPPDLFDRMRRLELVLTGDGRVRADRLAGAVPAENLDVIPAEMVEGDDTAIFGAANDLKTYLATLVATYAPTNASFVTQTPNATLTAEQALSALATGLLKVATATGVLSTAVANTDYLPVNNPAATGLLSVAGIRGSGVTPSAAAGAAMGTTPGGLTVIGSDVSGRISQAAGTATVAGTLWTVTFAAARASANYRVALTLDNVRSAVVQPYTTNRATGGFDIDCATAPLASNTQSIGWILVDA